MEPQIWHTLVVRLWRDGDGLKIRFLSGQIGQRLPNLTVATSVESATRQFEQWVTNADSVDRGSGERQTPAVDGATPRTQARRHHDDAGNDAGKTDEETAGS